MCNSPIQVGYPPDGGLVVEIPNQYPPVPPFEIPAPHNNTTIDIPGGGNVSFGVPSGLSVSFPNDKDLEVEFPAGSIGKEGPFPLPATEGEGSLVIEFPSGGTLTMLSPKKKDQSKKRWVKVAGSGVHLTSKRVVSK